MEVKADLIDPIPAEALKYIVFHVLLPPRLPQEEDQSSENDQGLLRFVQKLVRAYQSVLGLYEASLWNTVITTVSECCDVHVDGGLSAQKIRETLRRLETPGYRIFHVAAQNAGILIRTEGEEDVVVETFEASSENSQVLASKGALLRSFPGNAVMLSRNDFHQEAFQRELSKHLHQMSIEVCKQFQPVSKKAGVELGEDRATTDPALVTNMLSSLFEAIGQVVSVENTDKRIHDEVLWNNARKPWRRCPLYLVLRVGLQRCLSFVYGATRGLVHYKNLMAMLVAKLCVDLSKSSQLPVDMTVFAAAKLVRRVQKLEVQSCILPALEEAFTEALEACEQSTIQAWDDVKRRTEETTRPTQILPLKINEGDAILSLTNSGRYLTAATPEAMPPGITLLKLRRGPRISLDALHGLPLLRPEGLSDFDLHIALAETESWVKHDLPIWEEEDTTFDTSCNAFTQLVYSYEKIATPQYKDNPEQMSVMLLTILELWCVMDRKTAQLHPILNDFSTSISTKVLETLYLRDLEDMDRLLAVEKHLRSRCAGQSIFADPCPKSLACCFHDESPGLIALHQRILQEDQQMIDIKREQWALLAEQHSRIRAEIEQLEHDLEAHDKAQESSHEKKKCARCEKERKANALVISVYESLIPTDNTLAKTVVFELCIPPEIHQWRDLTWHIVQDLGRSPAIPKKKEPSAYISLRDYSPLNPYASASTGRLTLASIAKPFLKTHYSNEVKPIRKVSLGEVCVPNALQYRLYDSHELTWVSQQQHRQSLLHFTGPTLPPNSAYLSLYDSIASTGQPPNSIIANQSLCPPDMSLFEYQAFQEVRSSTKLQWDVMLREFALNNINFTAIESSVLYELAASQAGPDTLDDVRRDAYWQMGDEDFCIRLVEQLSLRLKSIEANWQQQNCMRTIIILLLRISSLATSQKAVNMAEDILHEARCIAFAWMTNLQEGTAGFSGRRATAAAMLCRRTFESSLTNLWDDDSLTMWVRCSIQINNNTPGKLLDLPILDRNEALHDRKVALSLEYQVRRSILAKDLALSQAVNWTWSGFSISGSWINLDSPDRRWFETTITSDMTEIGLSTEMKIHYNILEGIVLVDGRDVGKLPQDFIDDHAYWRLFGTHTFEVYPSNMEGMRFMALCEFDGNQVHFGARGNEKVIRTRCENKVMELIAPTRFLARYSSEMHDLPYPLIRSCVHWLDVDSGNLEIRPLKSCWRRSSDDWTLDRSSRILKRRDETLIDPSSALCRSISAALEPLEAMENLVITADVDRRPCVKMPRYDLRFEVNDNGELECSELGAVVDNDQNVGTMYGLRSKLVLESPSTRFMLVPRGKVLVERRTGHVSVTIDTEGKDKVQYCKFSINSLLGRLDCHHDLHDIYLKAYLHALTSFCMPDELTRLTGTEEALKILASASAQPWAPLDSDCHFVLAAIDDLTPKRCYYPRYRQEMQQISWNDTLHFTSQHDDFRVAVEAIVAQSNATRPFHPRQIGSETYLDGSGDPHLSERARLQNMLFRNADNCFRSSARPADTLYLPRDRRWISEGSDRVFEVVSLVKQWSFNTPVTDNLIGNFENMINIGGFHKDQFETISLNELLEIDFAPRWGSVFKMASKMKRERDTAKLMFLAAFMAFGKGVKFTMLCTLLSVAFMDDLKTLLPPRWSSYERFQDGARPDVQVLRTLVQPNCKKFMSVAPKNMTAIQKASIDAKRNEHQGQTNASVSRFVSEALMQWPCEKVTPLPIGELNMFDVHGAIANTRTHWLHCYKNYELSIFLTEFQKVLRSCQVFQKYRRSVVFSGPGVMAEDTFPTMIQPSLQEVLQTGGDMSLDIFSREPIHAALNYENFRARECTPEAFKLEQIMKGFVNSGNDVERRYGSNLIASLRAYHAQANTSMPQPKLRDLPVIQDERCAAEALMVHSFRALREAIKQHPAFKWLKYGLAPKITPVTLLSSLSAESRRNMNPWLFNAILQYGVQITHYQRAMRTERALKSGRAVQYQQELENLGHENWYPRDYPEWLVFEIESDLMIRTEQTTVAREIMSPSSGRNSTLQLNMGGGKSSVIIPMIILALADSTLLVRVVIPKPLLLQMTQILGSRLGRLLNRPVYHLGFSRATTTDPTTVDAFRSLHERCKDSRGVMLTLPEHLLSFKLSGEERLSQGNLEEALPMLELQRWITANSRDVIDECDQILGVRVQLIYPSGRQTPIDGAPNRWCTIQTILELLRSVLCQSEFDLKDSLSVIERGNGGYPDIYIIRESVEEDIVRTLGRQICSGAGEILPMHNLPRSILQDLEQFIVDKNCSSIVGAHVLDTITSESTKKDVLLLRGLLACRILPTALKKRWNVQYGLHPSRCLIAVPYLSKGIPSPNSEFGHVDVAILLTCLAYYYTGLSRQQFKTCLESLSFLDDHTLEFDRWTASCTALPAQLRSYSAINLDDEQQLAHLWKFLRCTTAVVDYFCNTMVFPKEAKGFEKKLTTSAWDILLTGANTCAQSKDFNSMIVDSSISSLTTGFSGTNDFADLLPLSIQQQDLHSLLHTNAEVLTTLLQPRNSSYMCAVGPLGRKLEAKGLVELVAEQQPPIQIILDAGAQILEMSNRQLVKFWLTLEPDARAAIFFDKGDKLMVLYHDGRQEALSGSPYASEIDQTCLVYLDEAHTRGTDLKLPVHARAALTIGAFQTKDHTVQAAMRMRNLSHQQSVMFFAPPEVDQSIKDLVKHKWPLESSDVIKWILTQTCRSIQMLQPLFVSQGLGYCKRQEAFHRVENDLHILWDDKARVELLRVLEEPESLTLQQLYGPQQLSVSSPGNLVRDETNKLLDEYKSRLNTIRSSFTGPISLADTTAHEEQERELAVEVQDERQVQRPPRATPVQHHVSKAIKPFMQTGTFLKGQAASLNAFRGAIRNTRLELALGERVQLGGDLLATEDFVSTVVTKRMDEYQRPVNWILWSNKTQQALIVSPWEAEALLPELQNSAHVHLISYAAPLTQKTLIFDSLKFRTIPALPSDWKAPEWLVRALGLFAGRLYFSWEEYESMCLAVGFSGTWQDVEDGDREMRDVQEVIQPVLHNPVPFVVAWLGIRRKGQDFTLNTPMGLLCRGKKLTKDHVFFRARTDD